MDDIIFRQQGRLAIAILNRPAALNAQTAGMVAAFAAQLDMWEQNPAIDRLLIRGAGDRAFCAGGDVRALWARDGSMDFAAQMQFFDTEYELCYRLAQTRLETVAYMDGITMGGGVGLSVFADHRLATPRTVWAMPEAQIGFFPDIAASYFFTRMDPALGRYLALTGHRLSGADCLAVGIATGFVAAGQGDALEAALEKTDDINDVLADFKVMPEISSAPELIETLMPIHGLVLPDYLAALGERSLLPPGLCRPSLSVIDAMLGIGARLSHRAAVDLDKRIVRHFLQNGTFREGVRARLVDKNGAPDWPDGLWESAKCLTYFI